MIRLLIAAAIRLLANAVGLLVADWVLEDMSLTASAFVIAVALFTLIELILDPLFTKVALTRLPALRGSVALVTTFVGLLVTTWLTDGLDISGASTWVFATLIVWLGALLAALLLPLVLVKKAAEDR